MSINPLTVHPPSPALICSANDSTKECKAAENNRFFSSLRDLFNFAMVYITIEVNFLRVICRYFKDDKHVYYMKKVSFP